MADVFADPTLGALGQRLCDAVAELSYEITASVGVASVRCDEVLGGGDPKTVITALIASADAAMYDAKRDGGNRSRQRVGPVDESPTDRRRARRGRSSALRPRRACRTPA